MPRYIAILLVTVMVMVSSPAIALSPQLPYPDETEDFKVIFNDIVSDYELYTSLLNHTYYDDPYLVSTLINSPEAGFNYLSAGFAPPLAQSIVQYYMQWIPRLGKMAVIPTDSVPVITASDRSYINIQRISPTKVILERIYPDCYEKGDRWLYRITAYQEENHWLIVDLYFEPVEHNSQP